MNCAVHPTANVLAVGMDNKCQLLEVDIKEEVRNVEKAKGKNKVVGKEKSKRFIVNELQSTVTVSAEDGDEKDDDVGFQKVVRFTADGNYIVTGGSDGHVRVLKVISSFNNEFSLVITTENLHCFDSEILLLLLWTSQSGTESVTMANMLFLNTFFQYPSLECAHDIKAHSTDVDDLDVHPNSIQVIIS